jgi:hypothetical protein
MTQESGLPFNEACSFVIVHFSVFCCSSRSLTAETAFKQITVLFHDHPELIDGFRAFLPEDLRAKLETAPPAPEPPKMGRAVDLISIIKVRRSRIFRNLGCNGAWVLTHHPIKNHPC